MPRLPAEQDGPETRTRSAQAGASECTNHPGALAYLDYTGVDATEPA